MLIALICLVAVQSNQAVAVPKEPTRAQIIKAYPKLYAKAKTDPKIHAGRNLLKHGNRKGDVVWNDVYRHGLKLWRTYNPGVVKQIRIHYLDTHPSQLNNIELTKLLYPNQFWAFDQIIAGGDGIGGKPGESDWHHNVWNGGHLGAWPDRTSGGTTSARCNFGDAYGLGQACERYKMEQFAGTTRIYDSPKLQLAWMVHYATGRYGSIEAAANYWRANGHW